MTPSDEVSKQLLSHASSELAIEDCIAEAKLRYRKKKIKLKEYLETIRHLSERQFKNIATKRKIMAFYG